MTKEILPLVSAHILKQHNINNKINNYKKIYNNIIARIIYSEYSLYYYYHSSFVLIIILLILLFILLYFIIIIYMCMQQYCLDFCFIEPVAFAKDMQTTPVLIITLREKRLLV